MAVGAYKSGNDLDGGEGEDLPLEDLDILLYVSGTGFREAHDEVEELLVLELVPGHGDGLEALEVAPDAVLLLRGVPLPAEELAQLEGVDAGEEVVVHLVPVDARDHGGLDGGGLGLRAVEGVVAALGVAPEVNQPPLGLLLQLGPVTVGGEHLAPELQGVGRVEELGEGVVDVVAAMVVVDVNIERGVLPRRGLALGWPGPGLQRWLAPLLEDKHEGLGLRILRGGSGGDLRLRWWRWWVGALGRGADEGALDLVGEVGPVAPLGGFGAGGDRAWTAATEGRLPAAGGVGCGGGGRGAGGGEGGGRGGPGFSLCQFLVRGAIRGDLLVREKPQEREVVLGHQGDRGKRGHLGLWWQDAALQVEEPRAGGDGGHGLRWLGVGAGGWGGSLVENVAEEGESGILVLFRGLQGCCRVSLHQGVRGNDGSWGVEENRDSRPELKEDPG